MFLQNVDLSLLVFQDDTLPCHVYIHKQTLKCGVMYAVYTMEPRSFIKLLVCYNVSIVKHCTTSWYNFKSNVKVTLYFDKNQEAFTN